VREDYAEIFRSPAAAAKYDTVTYAAGTYAARVDARQRRWLRGQLPSWFARPPVQHDFACGTGRAIGMLSGLVAAAHGYDTSPAMLERARERPATAVYHLIAPGPGAVPDQRYGGPRLVTMFRFLLNADDAARDGALDFAARVLAGDAHGVLVVENHGPARSLRGLGRWRHRDDPWFAELPDEEVVALLRRHGFRVVARRGFGVLPPGAYRYRGIRGAAASVDAVAHRLPSSPFAGNLIYVAVMTG